MKTQGKYSPASAIEGRDLLEATVVPVTVYAMCLDCE